MPLLLTYKKDLQVQPFEIAEQLNSG